MAGQPRASFYVVVAAVVAGLVAFALYRADILAPKGKTAAKNKIDPGQLGQKAESPDTSAPATTVKEYTFRAAERLPDIKGTSAYKPMEDTTVRFSLNV